jgi:hypothetical protein
LVTLQFDITGTIFRAQQELSICTRRFTLSQWSFIQTASIAGSMVARLSARYVLHQQLTKKMTENDSFQYQKGRHIPDIIDETVGFLKRDRLPVQLISPD